MENVLFTTVVEGYTKEEALGKVTEVDIVPNATTAWRNAGEPTFNSDKFKAFAEQYITSHKMTAGGGAYIVKTSAVKDTRLRPYKIINHKQEGKTKWETRYNIHEYFPNLDEDQQIGKVVNNEAQTKAEAEAIMKDLTSQNKACYCLIKRREVAERENNSDMLMECLYQPSKSAKPGEFYVFGIIRK